MASGASSYTWSPPFSTGATVSACPLVNTVYTVTATNALGCTGSRTVGVVVNSAPLLIANAFPGSICAGQLAALTVSTNASSFIWTPGNITTSPANVSPAATTIYTVVATLNTCTTAATATVIVNPIPSVSATASPSVLCSGNNITTTLTATGAANYAWQPGSGSGSPYVAIVVGNTTYTVTGTSAAGCSNTATVSVAYNSAPTLSLFANPGGVCAGGCTTITALGGTSYTWSTGGSGSQLSVCPPVTTVYSVIGANAQGCTSTQSLSVVVSPTPSILTFGPNPIQSCPGTTVGLIMVSPLNNFTWTPGNITSNPAIVSPASTTVYTVTASNGTCTSTATKTVLVNPAPVLNASANPASICPGGISTLNATGANSYIWTPGLMAGNTVTVSPASTTIYTVTGINSFNCAGTRTVSVLVNPAPIVQISGSSASICSGSTATLSASGAVSYIWSPGGSTSAAIIVSPASTTIYTVTGFNAAGCSNSASFGLAVNPTPTLSASALNRTVCAGFTTALTATGGASYTWTPGNLVGSPVMVTVAGTTIFTVTSNVNGCFGSATVNVIAVPLPTLSATANPAALCAGGTVTLSATGALTYTWVPMFVSGSSVTDTPSSTTIYTVAGFAASGCPNYTTVTVVVQPAPVVTAASTSTGICTGGSATLTASGANSYTWNPGNNTGISIVVNPLVTTVYTVTGDNGSCTGSTSIVVAVNPLPSISASAAPPVICQGSPVSLSASGALNYTWMPGGATGAGTIDNPLLTTTYTVTGEDANGCSNTANVTVTVNPTPTITASASPTAICEGSPVTLSAIGANTFTWSPGGATGSTLIDTPLTTITYTVDGTDSNGCVGTGSVQVIVVPNPTITVSPLNSSICVGSQATLTATGANSYTWLPSGTLSSVTIESPVVNTTYTVMGDNAGLCFSSFTVDVFVNPLPANVIAACSGTITCASPSVDLIGSSTDTNVSYSWAGPLSYTSNAQNPIGVTVWGTFTLYVTDNNTGCVATVTLNVPTDNSIPLVNATSSGSITCAASSVTLNAVHTTTNPGYSWNGPAAFTSTVQTFTVSVPGDYTVVVTDLSSTCTGSSVVSVGIHTAVEVTATITAATCSAGITNNDGTILVSNFGALDAYDLVLGTTYTGTLTLATAPVIPSNSIITANLANPTTTVPYTLRVFDAQGCIKDYVLLLVPVDCAVKTLGIAKSVLTPTTNSDGTYDVTYKVVVKNYGPTPLTGIQLKEDLSVAFPLPSTFSIVSTPSILTQGSGLTLDPAFDGVTTNGITNTGSSTIGAGITDTIAFTVRVNAGGFFGPFNNSVIGYAINSNSLSIRDTSNAGFDPDPDLDNNPYNNNVPTVLTLTPDIFFGLTKVGEFQKQDNNTYNISYTITVHNLGNDTLTDVVVRDSLFDRTIRHPATYVMKSSPVVTGGLAANSSFNGSSDINLLSTEPSKLPPGTRSDITFVINVQADTVTILRNSAYGMANKSHDPENPIYVSDTSNTGTNPDVNGNHVWNEASDNVPTVLILPSTHTLFIPQGFSPNGDGVNDVFKIVGLPEGQNGLTIFNRWGNRVYMHSNYKNDWDGYPNIAGTLGRDKLPQGTYYFILDMKGSGIKPITGFIVLQY
jgi:gliding motility-associated-like protein/uncharacterized repeat protein (TIGR01451 family)